MSRRRVAILGGGQAALTAALQLTDPANPDPAEVTLYQLGWRLGGKGATGRATHGPPRIMEHGLHEWFGFYENSFRQIRAVYAELARPPEAPLATWEQAFVGTDTGFLVEWCEGSPLLWKTTYMTLPGAPGDGETPYEALEHLARALEDLDGKLAGTARKRRALVRVREAVAAVAARGLIHLAARLARAHANAKRRAPFWPRTLER